ncbi:MAG: DUF4097 family beta strand repeat-containing protein [Mycobacterium leprae]
MQTWEKTFSIAPGSSVNIDQHRGKIEVTGWEQPEIKVIATTQDEEPIDERLEVAVRERSLILEVRRRARSFFGLFRPAEPPIDLVINLPVGTACVIDTGAGPVSVTGTRAALKIDSGSGDVVVADVASCHVDTGSGDVEVQGVAGAADIDTGSGAVLVRQVGGSASVDTGSGDVTISQVSGGLKVDTGSGDVTMADVEGNVEVDTGSGAIALARVKGPKLHLDTGNGAIRGGNLAVDSLHVDTGSGSVDLELVAINLQGRYLVDTGSGEVTLTLPADAGLTLELDTNSGRIQHDGLAVEVTHMERGELAGTLNGGGARLKVDTGSGDIRLVTARGTTRE